MLRSSVLLVLLPFWAMSAGQQPCERPAAYPAKSELPGLQMKALAWIDHVTKLNAGNWTGIASIPAFPADAVVATVTFIECLAENVVDVGRLADKPGIAEATFLLKVKSELDGLFDQACGKIVGMLVLKICKSETSSTFAHHLTKSHGHRFNYLWYGTPGSKIMNHAINWALKPEIGPIDGVQSTMENRCRAMERSLIHDTLYHPAEPSQAWKTSSCASLLACTLTSLTLSVIAEYGCRAVGGEGFHSKPGDMAEKAVEKVRDFTNRLLELPPGKTAAKPGK